MSFHVYIVASRRNGTLYIGSTDNLARRVWEHREKLRPGFTSRYGVGILVWCRVCDTREAAKDLERRMKEWRRSWKLRLIEESNPDWLDLYETLNQ
ncbi:GIY-YIG nuclease family protein [Caulobacter mirabilis]|uniref:GIY-YIG nuclease n=1 Tax=Caulobacter mirabilis TaxID=69666 RepID=A0A2D2ASR0_9CAUL|nr:GIY-YIG nuclease family protein [Caulobacter mirabilis]ATQ41039.1 GIY-YIG nuclease [Caulobacter mirabilis]